LQGQEQARIDQEKKIVKLASNENPLGASPKAIEAMKRTFDSLNLYPDGGLELRQVLAGQFDLKVDNVIAGSGSEGIMSTIIRAFLCDEDEVLTTEAAFIGFQVLARSRGIRYRTVPYSDWHYDLPALAAAISEFVVPKSMAYARMGLDMVKLLGRPSAASYS